MLGAGSGATAAAREPVLVPDGHVVPGDAAPDDRNLLRPPVQHVVIAATLKLGLHSVNHDLDLGLAALLKL